MIVHVTGNRIFWVESRFQEKDAVKAAGFLWHPATGCKPTCGACAAGLGMVWWTRHEEAARRLSEHADADTRKALGIAPPEEATAAVTVPHDGAPAPLVRVLENPDDLAAKNVYADWLLERGDPRGEFIQVQCEKERATRERIGLLVKAERRLLRSHQGAWLDDIRSYLLSFRWRQGFLYAITLNERRWIESAADILAREPVRRVRIQGVYNLPGVLGVPELGRVAALSLPEDRINAGALRVLLASPHVGKLRGLDLSLNPLGDEGMRLLAAMPFPALRELRLFACAAPVRGGTLTREGLRPLLEAPFIPRLRELDLRGSVPLDEKGEVGSLLAHAPFSEGMTLDLSFNGFDKKTAAQLLSSRLPRLRLNVVANDIGARDMKRLAEHFTLVERERTSTGELHEDMALDL